VSSGVRRGQNTMTSIVSLGLSSISCEVCLNESTARPCVWPNSCSSLSSAAARLATRGSPPRDPPAGPAYGVCGKSAEFCVSLAKQPSGHNLSTQQVGPRWRERGRCFSLRLIIPVLSLGYCFEFIQGRASGCRYIEDGRRMMLSSGELDFPSSYLDCSRH
jgi:hypothetical protein